MSLSISIASDSQKSNCSTSYSRVVTYHSTDKAITDLTSEIGRDPVCSSMYDRSWVKDESIPWFPLTQITRFIAKNTVFAPTEEEIWEETF